MQHNKTYYSFATEVTHANYDDFKSNSSLNLKFTYQLFGNPLREIFAEKFAIKSLGLQLQSFLKGELDKVNSDTADRISAFCLLKSTIIGSHLHKLGTHWDFDRNIDYNNFDSDEKEVPFLIHLNPDLYRKGVLELKKPFRSEEILRVDVDAVDVIELIDEPHESFPLWVKHFDLFQSLRREIYFSELGVYFKGQVSEEDGEFVYFLREIQPIYGRYNLELLEKDPDGNMFEWIDDALLRKSLYKLMRALRRANVKKVFIVSFMKEADRRIGMAVTRYENKRVIDTSLKKSEFTSLFDMRVKFF